MYYNGMTIEEIADWQMSHSIFDEEHVRMCQECREDQLNYIKEQSDTPEGEN